ncbi:MAG: dTMP kinase [Candidatus Levyibacteriota bacterium]
MIYPVHFTMPLKRNPYPGLYIAFEGIDGSGKSTQLHLVKKYFEDLKKDVILTSEPRQEGQIQEIIRDALFSKIHIPSRAYQHLYSADRVVNHAQVVEPALEKGSVVLTHRSFWSAVAYGILDLGEEYRGKTEAHIEIAHGIFSYYHQFIAPDITFYLKVSAEKAVERLSEMEKEKDIYEKGSKLKKIAHGYDTLVEHFSPAFIVIDGEQNEEEVTGQIIQGIESYVKS